MTISVYHQQGQGICLLIESLSARDCTVQVLLSNLESIPMKQWESFYQEFIVNGSGDIKGPYFHLLTMEGKTFIVMGHNPLVSSISRVEGKVSLNTISGCKSVMSVDNEMMRKAMGELLAILRLCR